MTIEELQVVISAEIADLKQGIQEASGEIEKLEKTGDSKMKAFGNAVKGAGKVVAGAMAAAATAVAAGATALAGLAESTEEYRANQAKLQTAFESAGASVEQATATYNELYRVLGDDDVAVEAAGHLAKLTQDQQSLSEWTTICQGVYATFGDSLPIEGLAEAANETAKTGALTGSLADALNWAGVNEDEFAAKLEACNSEAEREQLIRETLNGLYTDAAATYETQAESVLRANEAQAKLNESLGALGEAVAPIVTIVQELGAELLSGLVPGLTEAMAGIQGLLEGTEGASEQLQTGLTAVIENLLTNFTEALPQVLDLGIQLITSLLEGIIQVLPDVVTTVVEAIPQVVDALLGLLPDIIECGVEMIVALIDGLSETIPDLIQAVIEITPEVIDALLDTIPDLLDAAIEFFTAIVEAIPEIVTQLLEALPDIITTVIDFVVEAVPQLLDAAIEFFMAIIDAIPEIIDALIENLPDIIDAVITGVLDAAPLLLDAAIEFFFAIIEAIPELIDSLIKNMPKIIETIIRSLINALPKIFETAKKLFNKIIEAIGDLIRNLPRHLTDIITSIKDGLTRGFSTIREVGKDLIRGLWNGISDMASWIGEKIRGFGNNVLSGIKNFFGIKSPSRIMRDQVGKYLAMGLGEGFMTEMSHVNRDIQNAVKPLTSQRSFEIAGSITPTTIQAANGGSIASESENRLIDSLTAALLKNSTRPVVLQVDGKTFAETTISTINDLTRQTGALSLVLV